MSTLMQPVLPPITIDAEPLVLRHRRRRPHTVVFNLIALAVFAVFAFPVYWMVLTSFRRGVDIQRPTPEFVPSPGTLQNYRKVFHRDFFWTAVKNSLTVTL
ncbi:MAG: N,N-diacetylchitobiose transport system permease protein, partial [Ilumatobacteraceae bacterium]|nr:N,N-diacetylchitobiose transport system permease protein [Ilumatobacteraceae bacterium]